MADKKYIVGPGQNITIKINRKSGDESRQDYLDPKGLIKPRREDDYPARRIQPAGITFYDLGLIKSGDAYQDIDFQVITDWTNLGGSGLPFPEGRDPADVYADRDAAALANFETAAQILPNYTDVISGALVFDADVVTLSESAKWSSKGFSASAEQLGASFIALAFDGSFFDTIILKGSGANKITATNSYDADAAEFSLQKTDKIYLVPVVCDSYKIESFDSHEGFYRFVQQLNAFSLLFPRVPVLNGTAPAAIDGKTLSGARVMRSTQDGFGGAFTNSEQPASAFESDSTNTLSHTTATPEGFLVAIIKQGNNIFYVWKD